VSGGTGISACAGQTEMSGPPDSGFLTINSSKRSAIEVAVPNYEVKVFLTPSRVLNIEQKPTRGVQDHDWLHEQEVLKTEMIFRRD